MIAILNADLTISSRPDSRPLPINALEASVGEDVLSRAARTIFQVNRDVWSIDTPGGSVDLWRTAPDGGVLRVSHVTALPWLYMKLFGTPQGFVDVSVALVGCEATKRAYAVYRQERGTDEPAIALPQHDGSDPGCCPRRPDA